MRLFYYVGNTLMVPERQQEPIADQEAQPPQDSQPQADILKVVVAACQQIPRLQLLSSEPFGHLIIHDALHSSPSKIKDIWHLKLRGRVQVFVAATPSDLLDLLLQGGGLLGDDSYRRTGKQDINSTRIQNNHQNTHFQEMKAGTSYHLSRVCTDGDSFLWLLSLS